MCCDPVLEAEGDIVSRLLSSQHLDLAPTPQAAGEARRFVAGLVAELGEGATAALTLLTSELVTNAVLHARTSVQVGVIRGASEILVAVGDKNSGAPEPQIPSDSATQGRGLTLLSGLSHGWGVTAYDGGKTVWFVMQKTPPAGGSTPWRA